MHPQRQVRAEPEGPVRPGRPERGNSEKKHLQHEHRAYRGTGDQRDSDKRLAEMHRYVPFMLLA
jgi:hypothetical protein